LKRIFIKKDDALLTSYGVKTELWFTESQS